MEATPKEIWLLQEIARTLRINGVLNDRQTVANMVFEFVDQLEERRLESLGNSWTEPSMYTECSIGHEYQCEGPGFTDYCPTCESMDDHTWQRQYMVYMQRTALRQAWDQVLAARLGVRIERVEDWA